MKSVAEVVASKLLWSTVVCFEDADLSANTWQLLTEQWRTSVKVWHNFYFEGNLFSNSVQFSFFDFLKYGSKY